MKRGKNTKKFNKKKLKRIDYILNFNIILSGEKYFVNNFFLPLDPVS